MRRRLSELDQANEFPGSARVGRSARAHDLRKTSLLRSQRNLDKIRKEGEFELPPSDTSGLLVEERHAGTLWLIEIGRKQGDADFSFVEAVAMQGPFADQGRRALRQSARAVDP
jgi:hypothetical protein